MTEIDETRKAKQKVFFQKCMKKAGYKSYADLAEQIVLALPQDIDSIERENPSPALVIAQTNLAVTIGQLAAGNISPIQDKGKIRPLAIEVAGLLSIDPEALFFACPEFTYAPIAIADQDEEIDDSYYATSNLLLVQRDIVKAVKGINPVDLDIYIQIRIMDCSENEVASNLNLKECGNTSFKIRSAIKKVEALFERMRLYISSSTINTYDITSESASSLAVDTIFESKRVSNILRSDGMTDDSKTKLHQEFICALIRVDDNLSQVTQSGYVLHECSGSEITQLLRVFAAHQVHPSSAFLNACLSAKDIIRNDPSKWSYMNDFRDAVQGLNCLSANSNTVSFRLQSDYQKLLDFN